jgi:hypothetical protein
MATNDSMLSGARRPRKSEASRVAEALVVEARE